MSIIYKGIKDFLPTQLKTLFLSVGWSSGEYPDKLVIAMKNSSKVISAWDKDKLIGLMNALSDGAMTAYFHYLLIMPEYQSQGIGKELVKRMLKEYEQYPRKIIIAYDEEIQFYEKFGFELGKGKSPMFITTLST